MTKLLALLVLPALAQKRHATVVGGNLVKGAGKMTHGGKLHHYAGVLQAMNPALGKSEMVLECCGESASLASTVALGINTNQLTGDVKESIVPEFTGKNMCTEKDGDHHTASEKCSYVYAFQNKQWKDNSLTAICVPSDVCSVDVVGMTKGTKIGYSLVSQILNRNAGDLMYAGQGNINACHQAQMDVNNGDASKFTKEETKYISVIPGIKIPAGKKQAFHFLGMKEQGLGQMLSVCPPTPSVGMLYVYKNKYWDSEKGEINIAKFDAAIMEQKMKEKAAEDAKLAEEEVKSAEIEAKKLGLIKEEPKEEAAPEETKAPEKVGGGCDPNSKSSGCQRIDASADEAELTPMEKVAAVSEAAAKAEEEVKEAEETGTDPTEAATKALDAAVEKAEAAKVEAEEEVVSGILGAKELPIMDAVQPPPVVTTKLEVNADVKGQADKMAADMTAAQEKASAAAKAAAEKMAADMKATQEQMEAAAKATAEKLAAHTGAVQKAAADHATALQKATEDSASAVQEAAENHLSAISKAAKKHTAALTGAAQDVADASTDAVTQVSSGLAEQQKAAAEQAKKLQEQTEKAAAKVAADMKAQQEKAAAAAKAAAEKMAADMKATQEQMEAAAKATAEKLAAHTGAVQKAAADHATALQKATEDSASAVQEAAENHLNAISKAAKKHTSALTGAAQDVATFTADQATAAQDNVKQAVEALPEATIQSRRMSAVLI